MLSTVATVIKMQWIKAGWDARDNVHRQQSLQVLHDGVCQIHWTIVIKPPYFSSAVGWELR